MARILIVPDEGEEGLAEAIHERILDALGPDMDVRISRGPRIAEAQRRCPALLGESAAARGLQARVAELAASDAHVLLYGEAGAGKERIARAIHERGARRPGPFVAVRCAALPVRLIEAEVFGHVAGAFPGAVAARPGRIEQADGGTLYLHGVDGLSPALAGRVEGLLASGAYRPAGGGAQRAVDVRVICAIDRDDEGAASLLPDPALAERLSRDPVRVAPLRERPADIRIIAEHLLADAAARTGGESVLTDAALGAVTRHDFPGNLRELEDVLVHAAAAADGRAIDVVDLPVLRRGEAGGGLLGAGGA